MNTGASERTIARLFLAVFLVSLAGLWICRLSRATTGLSLGLSLFLLLIAPGFIPSLRIRQKLGLCLLEVLPFAVSISLGQATVLLLAFDRLGLSVSDAGWALIATTLLWYLWFELTSARGTAFGFGTGATFGISRPSRRVRALLCAALLLFLLAVSVLLLKVEAPLQWTTDAPAHLAAIRGVIEEHRIFPTMEPYGPNGAVKSDPRFGVFHALCAVLLAFSGVKIQVLWKALPALFSPLLALGLFSCTRSLTGSFKAAFATAFIFPLCYGGLGETLRIAGYPTRVSMLVYLVALSVTFRYLREQSRWLLVFLGILVATVAAIHVYYFIEFLFVVTCFFLVKLFIAQGDRFQIVRSWARIFGTTIGISLPFLVYKFFISYSTANRYSVEGQGLLYLGGWSYILNPLVTYGWFGFAGLVSLLLLPYFIVRTRKSDAHAFVTAATAGTLLLIFNPLVFPLASKLLSYLAWRLMWAVPYVLAIGIFLSEFATDIRSQSTRNKLLRCVEMGLVVAALLGTLNFRIGFYGRALESKRSSFSDDFSTISGVLERLDREIEGRRVFLSDPVTAYAIPAFTKHFVTAIPVAHSAPSDSTPVSRVRDALDVLNPSVSLERTIEVLRKYRVEYVVVNTGFSKRLRGFEYEIDPERQRRVLEKITSVPELFEEILAEENLHVFRVTNLERAETRREETARTCCVPDTSSLVTKPVADFSGLFSLEKVQISPASVLPGDTVSISLLWKCLFPIAREDVYMLFVRMDTDFPKGNFLVTNFEKPYRKFLERKSGKKFRIREDVDPEACDPPLHLWRRGEFIMQNVPFALPRNSSPGRYTVKVNLKRTSVSVNLHASDLFRDEDYYSGLEVGSIFVENPKAAEGKKRPQVSPATG